MAAVVDGEETATPSGIGGMLRTSTRIEASLVMHTFAPESAIEDVMGAEEALEQMVFVVRPTMVMGRVGCKSVS